MVHLLPFKSFGCQALILFVIMANITLTSGCAWTQFGYIPEDVTPTDNNTLTYREVKEWAYEVEDGYDTRATVNKYAIYGGALMGAAAVGAIAGLAAFDSGSSALVGIPIGMTFLASVAAVYSNEERARIYRLGAQYIKDLITLSDKRIYQCQLSAGPASTISQDAKKAAADADKQREKAIDLEELLTQRAKDTHAALDKLDPGASKDLEAEIAKDVDNRKVEATRGVVKAEADARSAAEDARDAEQCPRSIEQLQAKEALCLRVDVNALMRAVEDRKASLDPDDIVKRLKDGGAPATNSEAGNTSSSGSASNDGATGTVSAALGNFITDLNPPVKSSCGQF